MALAYLLSPTFEIVNTSGKPATGGYIEVYVAGSRDPYYCYSNWEGVLHPFKIPLDSLGSNVVLADSAGTYDVYVYNRYGSLLMSRYNVKPGAGGGAGGGAITSSDGSIDVTQTAYGYDLKVNGQDASVLRASANDLVEDGQFTFSELVRDGDQIYVDSNGKVRLEDGWYHYDITARVKWIDTTLENTETHVQLYTTLNSDLIPFDLSYEHENTMHLHGEVKNTTGGSQFTVGVQGIPSGMVVELVDFGIFAITGHGSAAEYEAGTGIVIDDHEISIDPSVVQEKLTAGTGIIIDDNEVSVDTDVIQEKLTAGSNIVIEGNTISATAEPQQQADWTEADSSAVSYIKHKPENLVQDANYVHTDNNFTDADKSKLGGIESGAEVNVQANWTEADSSSDAYIQNKPSNLVQDADYTHTDNNFTDAEKSKLAGIESGAEVNVQSDWTEADTTSDAYILHKPSVKPVAAGDNITITEGNDAFTISATDTTYTAGQNITITNNVISATAAPQLQSNWAENDNTSVQYIQNKPSEKSLVAGTHVTLTESGSVVSVNADWPTVDQTYDATSTNAQSGVAVASAIANNGLFEATYGTTTYAAVVNAISAHKVVYCRVSGRMAFLAYIGTNLVEFQYYRSNSQGTGDSVFVYTVSSSGWTTTERPAYVQSNWSTSSTTAASYIKNKPSIPTKTSDLTNDSGFITASDVPAQVQADWTEADTTSAAYIANKPNLALKEDVANKAQTLVASSTTDYPSSAATAQFVNSSIATATARFLGNYDLTDLGLTYPATDSQIETALDGYTFQSAPTNNDYVYAEIQNPQTTSVDDVVKRFKFNGTNWLYEYTLNNSSFTAAEIAAIDSGVNSTKVGNYDSHIADTTIHVTAADKTAWNGKQDAISDLSTIRSGAALGATSVQPSDLATVATTGDYSDLLNTPTLAAVATSGDYTDLSNTPHIPVIGTITL